MRLTTQDVAPSNLSCDSKFGLRRQVSEGYKKTIGSEESMKMNRIASAVLVAAIAGFGAGFASPAMGQTENPAGQAQLIVTVNANKSHQGRPLQ